MAPIEDSWVQLESDLKVGDRVQLIGENGASVHEVLELKENKFRTDFDSPGDEVFVYGREVDDFRSVDYEAIAMLNVSATQEIYKQLQAEQAKTAALASANIALEQRLVALEKRDQQRETRFTAIEKLLKANESTELTVSQTNIESK